MTRSTTPRKETGLLPDMEVLTWPSQQANPRFVRLKRTTWSAWKFLVSGEWVDGIMNQGNTTIEYAHARNRGVWALKHMSFPSRIVAIGVTVGRVRKEDALALMLARLQIEEFEWVFPPLLDFPQFHGDVDFTRFWRHYCDYCDLFHAQKKAASSAAQQAARPPS